MLPLIVLRPEPGATRTLEAALRLGLGAAAYPLFVIEPVGWTPLPRSEVDALLLGSANAIRHAGPALDTYRGLAAYCVGQTTADEAAGAGLDVVAVGKGGLQSLIPQIAPGHRRLLRLAGRERVDLAAPSSLTIIVGEVYASQPVVPAPAGLVAALLRPCVVMLHSAEAGARLVQICGQAGVSTAHVRIAAIGPRVVSRIGTDWAQVLVSETPDDSALLALAARMCQDSQSRTINAATRT